MADGEGEDHEERLQDLCLLDGSWREGDKVRNVHLGSCRKMDARAAKLKAKKMKADALGLRSSKYFYYT